MHDFFRTGAALRTHYMDALRSVLMLLGAVYHAALIYAPGFSWRVVEPDKSKLLGQLAMFLHTFRMPAFFIVAGYFSILLIKKYGESGFLRTRLQRIGVPLLATAILINPWTNYLSVATTTNAHTSDSLANYIVSGDWIVQLWFLLDLLVFCFVCVAGFKLAHHAPLPHVVIPFQIGRHINRISQLSANKLALGLCFTLPIVNAIVARVFWYSMDSTPVFAGAIDPGSLARFLPFFLFGCLLWYSKPLTDYFTNPWFWVPAVILGSIGVWMAPALDGKEAPRYAEFALYLESWGMSGLCLAFFRRFFDKPSAIFQYLSDASYTVYLTHMLFVVALGSLLAQLSLSPYVKFALVVSGTAAASLICHHFLVRPTPMLSFLFNGKTIDRRKKRPVPPEHAARPEAA